MDYFTEKQELIFINFTIEKSKGWLVREIIFDQWRSTFCDLQKFVKKFLRRYLVTRILRKTLLLSSEFESEAKVYNFPFHRERSVRFETKERKKERKEEWRNVGNADYKTKFDRGTRGGDTSRSREKNNN